jgi:hypothetical protein
VGTGDPGTSDVEEGLVRHIHPTQRSRDAVPDDPDSSVAGSRRRACSSMRGAACADDLMPSIRLMQAIMIVVQYMTRYTMVDTLSEYSSLLSGAMDV